MIIDSKYRLNLPFEFQEVILSSKDRARILKSRNVVEFNPFEDESTNLVVSDFRLSVLSVRLRTINNARETNANLPDGSPITEVTMYGKKGEIFLLGSYEAFKHVMAGDIPPNANLINRIQTEQRKIKSRLDRLRIALDSLYRDKRATAEFEIGRKVEIRIEHGFIVEKMILLNSTFLDKLQLFIDQIGEWRWWELWSPKPSLISNKVSDSIKDTDAAIDILVKQISVAQGQSLWNSTDAAIDILVKQIEPSKTISELTDHIESAEIQVDKLRNLACAINRSIFELKALLHRLIGEKRVTNITILGTLTQLLSRDIEYIEDALKDLEIRSLECQQLEQDIKGSFRDPDLTTDEDVIVKKTAKLRRNYKKTMARLKEKILS